MYRLESCPNNFGLFLDRLAWESKHNSTWPYFVGYAVSIAIVLLGLLMIWDNYSDVDAELSESANKTKEEIGLRTSNSGIFGMEEDEPETSPHDYSKMLKEALLDHNYEASEERMMKWKEREMAMQREEAASTPGSTQRGKKKKKKKKAQRGYYFDFISNYYQPPLCAQSDPHWTPKAVDETGFVEFLQLKKPGQSSNPIQGLLNMCGIPGLASDGTF